MDIIKFPPVSGSITLQNGIYVSGINSVMWIERYRDAGEFTITANVSSGIRDVLTIGSLISHLSTLEVMVVENHEISDAKGEDLEVTITGRSFETILEQRALGQNRVWPTNYVATPYYMPSNYTWIQAVNTIKYHTDPSQVTDQNDALAGVLTRHVITRTGTEQVDREFKLGSDLYSSIIELLTNDKLGIRTLRPTGPGNTTTIFEIHEGLDRTKEIIFSFDAGDITNADYLWSNKNSKDSIMVIGKWVQEMIKGSGQGYNRRVTMLDASDIDDHYQNQPPYGDFDGIRAKLRVRGNQVLRSMNSISLSKAQAAKNSKKYVYREHFNVGDIVLIDGIFNESSQMRVIEYVEISDKEGSSQYPTLSTYPEEP